MHVYTLATHRIQTAGVTVKKFYPSASKSLLMFDVKRDLREVGLVLEAGIVSENSSGQMPVSSQYGIQTLQVLLKTKELKWL